MKRETKYQNAVSIKRSISQYVINIKKNRMELFNAAISLSNGLLQGRQLKVLLHSLDSYSLCIIFRGQKIDSPVKIYSFFAA